MAKDLREPNSPHPVDRHVGLRIRMRRKELGISQERLAGLIRLTFQQIQKYERGANRVSASKLWDLAHALNTSIAYFYEGLGDPPVGASLPSLDEDIAVRNFMLSRDGIELALLFPKLSRVQARGVMALLRSVADEATPQSRVAAGAPAVI